MGTAELIAIGTFAAVILIVIGPYLLLVVRPEAANQEILRQRIKTGGGAVRQKKPAGVGLLKEVERLSVIGPLNKFLGGSGPIAANLRDMVHMSGLKITPGQIVLGSGCLALVGYLGVVFWISNIWLGVIAGLVLGALPYTFVRILRARRLAKFEEQFPEAVDLIARTLRAGHAFTTGLRMASEELPQPVAAEFKLLFDQQNYGLPITDALHALAKRVPLIDARFFVTAVLTQRDAGGNLAEVLDNLSAVIRERFKIKRQLRVVSAHGRLTGAVLAGLPPALGLFLLLRMPGHFKILLESSTGIRLIVGAVLLQVVGAYMIYKITKVEY